MTSRRLISALPLSAQLSPGNAAQVACYGIRAIIDKQSNGEQAGLISAAEMVAIAHGLGSGHVPSVSRQISDEDVARIRILAQTRETKAEITLSAAERPGDELKSIRSGPAPKIDGVSA